MTEAPKQESFVIEVEQEVLGSLLMGADFRRVISILQEHHFLEGFHRVIFTAIQSAHERYNSTLPAIVNRLIPSEAVEAYKANPGGNISSYIARLATSAVLGPSSIENSAKRVVEQWARVSLSDEAARLHAAANDPSSNPVELMTNAGIVFDDILADVRRGPRRKSQVSIIDAAQNAFSAARDAAQRGSGLTGITWGLTDVNQATGGIHKRDLTLIGARPSMGKTTTALSVGLKAAKSSAGVGFISLEMDADKLAARAISDVAYDWNIKVPYQDVITGRASAADLDALESVARDIEKLPLIIEEQSGLSILDIRIKLESMMSRMEKESRTLDLLMIDHLGLIRASNRYSGNRNNEIAEMTGALKSMAREYGIAVVLLSQLNRALEQTADKRPQLSSLRDSGAIEQDADTIIFLYREAYYLEREKGGGADKEAERTERLADCQNTLEFHIAKQRNGPVKTIDLFIDVACSAVRNASRF